MREIKFRGKGENNIWFYGHLVKSSSGKAYIYPLGSRSAKPTRVDPDTIGQYTGIKDDTGVEIYENDVLSIYNNEWPEDGTTLHSVRYKAEDDYPAFDLDPILDDESNGLSYAKACCKIEVVGDTHNMPDYENLELINEPS